MQDHSCVCFFVCSIEVGKISGCLRWLYLTLVSESPLQQQSPNPGGGGGHWCLCQQLTRKEVDNICPVFLRCHETGPTGEERYISAFNRTSDSLPWLTSSLPFKWLDRVFSIPIKYDINSVIRFTSLKYDGCKYICEVTKSLCLGRLAYATDKSHPIYQ